jgi:hypothetical protein
MVTESVSTFLKQKIETVAVFVVQESGLTAIASENDVRKSA